MWIAEEDKGPQFPVEPDMASNVLDHKHLGSCDGCNGGT